MRTQAETASQGRLAIASCDKRLEKWSFKAGKGLKGMDWPRPRAEAVGQSSPSDLTGFKDHFERLRSTHSLGRGPRLVVSPGDHVSRSGAQGRLRGRSSSPSALSRRFASDLLIICARGARVYTYDVYMIVIVMKVQNAICHIIRI